MHELLVSSIMYRFDGYATLYNLYYLGLNSNVHLSILNADRARDRVSRTIALLVCWYPDPPPSIVIPKNISTNWASAGDNGDFTGAIMDTMGSI